MPSDQADHNRRRLGGFVRHLGTYLVVALILAVVNFSFNPDSTWSILPIVGWSPVLALHAAYAMGLFEIFKNR